MADVRISELIEKTTLADTDLMIVQDTSDTKKVTVASLKNCFTGLSAYDEWLALGNTGTEAQFIASLKGDSGSPKGVYATLALLQAAFPTGTTGVYVVTADGKWYYWSGSAWVVGGTYQTTGIVDGSIAEKMTSFFSLIGKNIFDKSKVTGGYYVDNTTGNLAASSLKSASDYMPILPSTQYVLSGDANERIAFYNNSKVYISGLYPTANITSPIGAVFARVSLATANLNIEQFELGSVATVYETYKLTMSGQSLGDKTIPSTKFDFLVTGKNLFDKSLMTVGKYVDSTTGLLITNASYWVSDYIAVDSSSNYAYNYFGQMAFYDINKTYISGITGGGTAENKTCLTPSNAKYARFSTKLPDVFQVEKGIATTTYEAYKKVIPSSLLNDISITTDSLLLFLPSEICVAVGRTIELYNKLVSWCGNINNYHFQWVCQVGHSMKRKFSVTGVTIGEYPLTLNVYDNNMQLVKVATSTVKVVSNVLSTTKNILTIGDSLVNTTSTPKPWMGEVRSLSASKINFVGTRGLVTGEKHEGRSGWSAANYLSGVSYTFESEGVNPFWDGTRFNWNYYKTNTSIVPNAIQIWLGINGIELDPTINANNIKQMVDYIRQDDANIPISIVFTLYRGNQDGLGVQTGSDGYTVNQGAFELCEDKKVFALMDRLYSLLSGYTKLYFTPIALEMDRDNNFGQTVTPVNPRATQTELLPVEATHPQTQGYLQIADTQFSVYAKHYAD